MKVSIVIPVYNGSKSIKELCCRIDTVLSANDWAYEIVLVDDCSRDNSWEVMEEINRSEPRVKIIQLMKNFGQHNAILCGLNDAEGDVVVTMDDDLQHLPEEIPKLVRKVSEGYDFVIGAFEDKKDTRFKKLASFIFGWLFARIFNAPEHLKFGSFRAMTRAVCKEVRKYKTPYPFVNGIVLSMTGNVANVSVGKAHRQHGASNYSPMKLIRLAFNVIINYSSLILNIVAGVGFIVSILSFLIGGYFLFKKLIVGVDVEGWTSVVVLLSFFNGVLITILSLLGEYMVRIIGEVSNRSQYVVRKKSL